MTAVSPSRTARRSARRRARGTDPGIRRFSRLWLLALAGLVLGVGIGALVSRGDNSTAPILSNTASETALVTVLPSLNAGAVGVVESALAALPHVAVVSLVAPHELRVYFKKGITNAEIAKFEISASAHPQISNVSIGGG